MRLLPPPGERALPLLAGGLLAVAHPPFPLLLPVFVGLAPLLVFIAERPPGPEGRWSATRGALIAGTLFFGVQLSWVPFALLPFSPLAMPAYLGLILVLAGLVGAFGWALHQALHRTRLPLWLLAMLLWTSLEWLQAHLGPLSFPWLGLGTALAPYPALAGAAELVGSRGLTAWLTVLNGLVAEMLLLARQRLRWPDRQLTLFPTRPMLLRAVWLVVVAAVPIGFGVWRAQTIQVRTGLRVALAHTDRQGPAAGGAVAAEGALVALSGLTRGIVESVDLVIWPEIALPVQLQQEPRMVERIRRLSAEVGAPILVGAYGSSGEEEGWDQRLHNSAFLIDRQRPRSGSPSVARPGPELPRYDKRSLVPFVERVPLAGAVSKPRRYGGLARGDDGPLFSAAPGFDIGVLICYEAAFADLARTYRRGGADVLVNMSNDGWFGRRTAAGPSLALWQHPSHLVLRAIETRTGIARSANGGASMVIDPRGDVIASRSGPGAGVLVATASTTDIHTLFVRWGDWVGSLCAMGSLVLLLTSLHRPQKRLRRDPAAVPGAAARVPPRQGSAAATPG